HGDVKPHALHTRERRQPFQLWPVAVNKFDRVGELSRKVLLLSLGRTNVDSGTSHGVRRLARGPAVFAASPRLYRPERRHSHERVDVEVHAVGPDHRHGASPPGGYGVRNSYPFFPGLSLCPLLL